MSNLWPCLLALTLLTITPGVDTLLVIRNTGRGGWKDGVASSFGICCGLFFHALLSALGISLLLLQSALAFNLLKLVGAGYLVWLGFCSFRSALQKGVPPQQTHPQSHGREFILRRSLVEGLLSNILNPKTILFYMAFLPQFIDPAGSALQQSLLLAGLHFAIAMLYQTLLALAVVQAGRWLKNSALRRSLEGAAGAVLMSFGVKLALDP